MKKPRKCCDIGTFKCDVPMAIKGRVRCVDYCLAHIIAALNAANIETVASCCGHSKQTPGIILEDGRAIFIVNKPKNNRSWVKLWNVLDEALKKYNEVNS